MNTERKEQILEIIVAILLGTVALLTAWATWIGSLHGGNQATNYTKSNNLSAQANSTWSDAARDYSTDVQTWAKISDLLIEYNFAQKNKDTITGEKCEWKIQQIMDEEMTETFREAADWAMEQDEYTTPFEKEGYIDSYFEEANNLLIEAEKVLKQGQEDNRNGDRLGLVTVFYSVVLFLLGITNTFKNIKNKYGIIGISLVCMIFATVIMITVPLPTGFSLLSFFE